MHISLRSVSFLPFARAAQLRLFVFICAIKAPVMVPLTRKHAFLCSDSLFLVKMAKSYQEKPQECLQMFQMLKHSEDDAAIPGNPDGSIPAPLANDITLN